MDTDEGRPLREVSLLAGLPPDVLGIRPTYVPSVDRPDTPARLLIYALLWLLAAGIAGVVAALILARGFANQGAWTGQAHPWKQAPTVVDVFGDGVICAVMVLAARRRARHLGRGNIATGLGDGPIIRRRLLVVFGIAGLAIPIGMTALVDWGPLHLDWLKPDGDDAVTIMFGRLMAAGPFVQVTMVLSLAGLGPLSEEWFFRGWLWTGLRRHWRPVPVMLATALPWLLLHMMNSPLYPLFLVPGAISLSLARQYCGGVRASLTLHVLNNLIATGLTIVVLSAAPA